MGASELPLLPLPAPERRRELRKQMGITRAVASRELGVSPRTYYRWEEGIVDPHPGNHRKYSEQLTRWQTAVDNFLGGR